MSVKEHSMFVCLDDKHKIKVGEPGFPVAAAERGRQVLQAAGSRFSLETMISPSLVSSHLWPCRSAYLMIYQGLGTQEKSASG